MTILVVEDEWSIRKLLEINLTEAGYNVHLSADGADALDWITEHTPKLVLLDWMLSETSGLELLQSIRRIPEMHKIPVMMLTARGAEIDRITGLDFGADDYMTKPFSPKELLARVRALLRRSQQAVESDWIGCGDIQMSRTERRVWRDDHDVHLGPTEYRLLEHFLLHPGQVFSREQLLDQVWGRDVYVDERTVDVHIRRLRKALNLWGKDVIRTVRSMGYALEKH